MILVGDHRREGGGVTKKHHGIPIKKDQNFRYLCRWRPLCTSRIVRTTIGALSPVNIFSSWLSKRPAQRSRPTCIVKEISNLYLIRGKKEIGRRHLFHSSRQTLLRRDDFLFVQVCRAPGDILERRQLCPRAGDLKTNVRYHQAVNKDKAPLSANKKIIK